MKKILLYALALISAVSCSLDVDEKSAITTPTAWSSSSDAQAAVYGMMNRFRSAFNSNYMYWGEYRSGIWGPGAQDITQTARDQAYLNAIPSSHAACNWETLYKTINDANLILKHAPSISYNQESVKKQVLGSALFIRAFTYYWIVRIWGDAPLLLKGYESDEDMFPSRTPKSEIFAQIEKDLEEAASDLGDLEIASNMPNINAVYTLLTDLYLWEYKVEGDASALAKAKTACNNVLGKKTLLSSFASVFSNSNKNNNEEIFNISMIQDEAEGGAQSDWLCTQQDCSESLYENPVKVGSHQQWTLITSSFRTFLSSDPHDTRTSVTFQSYYDAGKKVNHIWMNKYAGSWVNSERRFDSDYIFYRYADVLFFDSEIACEEGDLAQAIASLNIIAKRAYGIDNYYSSSLTKDEILANIITEREKEFVCEGKIWWDYIRMGVVFSKVASLAGKENNKNILLWPISQTSLNDNPNLTQTEIEY